MNDDVNEGWGPPEDDPHPVDAWIPPEGGSVSGEASAGPVTPMGTGEVDDILDILVDQQTHMSALVNEHTGALEDLHGRLAALEVTPAKDKPDEWNLRELSPEDRREQWEALDSWIRWYNETFAPQDGAELRIPECWFLHAHARVVLLDLFYAWKAAQYGHRGPSSDAVYWDTVYLPAALKFAAGDGKRAGWQSCTSSKHDEDKFTTPARPVMLPKSFDTWLEEEADESGAGISGESAPRTDQIPVVAPDGSGEWFARAQAWEPDGPVRDSGL